jgi:hypothetical protein
MQIRVDQDLLLRERRYLGDVSVYRCQAVLMLFVKLVI